MSDPDVQVLHHRVSAVERAVERIADAVEKIGENTAQLAMLEQRHAETRDGLERAFEAIKKTEAGHDAHETRIRTLEIDMPALLETRRWVIGGILAIVALVGLGLVGAYLKSGGDQNVNIRVPSATIQQPGVTERSFK